MATNEKIQTDPAVSSLDSKSGLGLGSLVALATGTVVGSGVVSLVGVAAGVTGRSVWMAYGGAVLLGLLLVLPFIFLSSAIRVKGGNYSFVSAVLGDMFGGVYCLSFTMNAFVMGLFGVTLSRYIQVLLPQTPVKLVAATIITLFYVSNLFGVKLMSKLQNIMFTALLAGLIIYIVTGLANLRPDSLDISNRDFFKDGLSGFMAAVMILVFSTTGHYFVISFSKEANNAKRDIPLSIIITSGIILVLYVGVAFVTANVLPISQVEGQPLTVIAQETMPKVLYYLFVFGGPIMALTTTINSNFTIFSRPLEQATKDGWFPQTIAKRNKAGVPYKLITLLYIIGVMPLLLGFSVIQIVAYNILVDSISELVAYIAIIRYPNKLAEAWENRHFKISKNSFYIVMALSIIARIMLIVLSLNEVNLPIAIATVIMFVAFFLYSYWRVRTGKVNMEKSYELQ